MKEIEIQPNERVCCVILGDDEKVNKTFIKHALMMPGDPRRIVIGDYKPYLQQYIDMNYGIEFLPSGTPRPTGVNVQIIDGQAVKQ